MLTEYSQIIKKANNELLQSRMPIEINEILKIMASQREGIRFTPIPFISMATGYITLGQKSAIKKVVISTFVIIRKTFR